MVPIQDVVPVPQAAAEEEGPRRSSQLARQSEGLYINILEKALRMKKREESSSSCTSKVSKVKSKIDQEEDSGSIPPFLEVDQLIRLGKDWLR
jgi:hypothetical protein